ncbi:DUF779 domain-containing protein [Helicobacter saguini]|uniref:DUF779 domain-containing protein n=1 Tax=Helicobacter saguini TaxID=1548018 RepID=A0A347VSL0_9HELI|nr:DUF779 domain-containing protein [Helicobacter saguini]MWV62462.1 DUF779 domain-containing protein [Helicobacter saguini]MWV66865.1 DUF779 domain-containing protein [Helicobacter saguini]MWV69214.1 DUF779 domain-containing protein [Helicobacter saguini]MWV71231.1 DUF779 domain-containing protein [Helicobacter saguini]TLD93300.1 DUF779 domain-containing protein [Helicobacter saguini]
MTKVQDIEITQEAKDLLAELKAENNDSLILYLSGGCCDGSALLCYEKNDFKLGNSDVLLGIVENVGIYTHISHFSFLKNNTFLLYVENGNGSEYSLEYGKNKYFVLNTNICQKN